MIRKVIVASFLLVLATAAVAFAAKQQSKVFGPGDFSLGIGHEEVVAKKIKIKPQGTIKDIDVRMAAVSSANEDYTFVLRHPSGKMIHLSSGNGGTADNYGSGCSSPVVFDDEAETEIEQLEGVNQFIEGSWQPEQRNEVGDTGGLEELDGMKLKGTWSLIAIDTEPIGLGTLKCFKVDATYKPAKKK